MRRVRLFTLILVLWWLHDATAITLTWNPSERATGYKMYYGEASQRYHTSLDVGAATAVEISALPPGQTVFFAATAYNTAGESGFSNEVSAMIPPDTNPPMVTITHPADGETVPRKGSVMIEASAQDDVGVQYVQLRVNADTLCIDGTEPYRCRWEVPAPPGRTYRLQAEAIDTAGQSAVSAIVTVTSSDGGQP